MVVSTAVHEFFGIGVIEATSAGAVPLLPDRLAYPELLKTMGLEGDDYLYDGSAEHLARRLITTASAVERPRWQEAVVLVQAAAGVHQRPHPAMGTVGVDEGLKLTCEYFNPTNETIYFGTSALDEMCFLWAHYVMPD